MKFNRFLFAAFATLAFVACGNPNNNDDPEPEPSGASYTIVADKQTIEADGVDCVTFSVLDENGNDVTLDASTFKYVYFVDANSDKRLEKGTKTFAAIRDSEYTFYATVRGKKTQNQVTFTSQNRAKYEQYVHKVCVYQLTATWCGYCPDMTKGLKLLREGVNGNNVIVMAVHADDDYALPWPNRQNYDLGSYMCVNFGGAGYPYAVYDMAFGSGQRSESILNSTIEGQMLNYPATCGVKISEATMDGQGNTVITASVAASKDGKFDLGYAVLADNQPSQNGTESIYNDVVAAVSSNYITLDEATAVELKAGEEFTKTFNLKVEPFKGVSVSFNPSNYKVVVFAHSNAAGVSMVDNANTCAIGKTADYQYN